MGFGGIILPSGGSSLPVGQVGDLFTYSAEGAVWASPEELDLGGGGGPSVLTGNFSGPLAVFAATSRWYPAQTVTLSRVWASIGEVSEAATSFDIKKNGVSILQAPLTIASNQNRSLDVELDPTVQLLSTDYLTFAITAANGGKNASVFVEYA